LDLRRLAILYGATRLALGAAIALAPEITRVWIGDTARNDDVRGPLRVLGVRDALLGVALLVAVDNKTMRSRMLNVCAVADTADAITSARDFLRTRRPGAGLAAVTAAGGAAFGFVSARIG
jgi:hypothetical protein